MEPRRRGSSLGEAYRAAAPYLSLGTEFAVAVLLCLFLGRWLDQKFGTTPLLMLGATLLGVTAGFVHFFRVVSKLQNTRKPGGTERRDSQDNGSAPTDSSGEPR